MAEVAVSKKHFKKRTFILQGQRGGLAAAKSKQSRQKLTKVMRREVKAIIAKDIELKIFDVTSAYAQIDRGGQITVLSNVPQGVTQQERVGDGLRQKYLELNLDAYYNAAAISTDVGHKMRVIVVRYNIDTTLQALTIGSVLNSTGSAIITASAYNFTGKQLQDWTILYDKTFALNHASDVVIREHINLHNHHQGFSTGATTGDGQIHLILVGDDATGAHTPDIQAQWYSRFVYSDA